MANTETTINAVINPQNNDPPIDIEKTIKALERNKFVVHYFERGAEAVVYLKKSHPKQMCSHWRFSHFIRNRCS